MVSLNNAWFVFVFFWFMMWTSHFSHLFTFQTRRFCTLSKSARGRLFHTLVSNLHLVLRHEISSATLKFLLKHAKLKCIILWWFMSTVQLNNKVEFFIKCSKRLSDMLIFNKTILWMENSWMCHTGGGFWHKESWFFFWELKFTIKGEICKKCKSFSFLWKRSILLSSKWAVSVLISLSKLVSKFQNGI